MFSRIVIVALLIVCVASCDSRSGGPGGGATRDEFKPIKNGFGYGVYSKGIIHRRVGASLQYRDTNGRVTDVWPYLTVLSGDSVQIISNSALFIGGKADTYKDGVERLTRRLMAFEAPGGPPLDITDQVLRKWCDQHGLELTNILKDALGPLTKTNDALQIEFVVIEKSPSRTDVSDGSAIISWSDLEAIIQDVKKTGTLREEKWSGVEYLQKD